MFQGVAWLAPAKEELNFMVEQVFLLLKWSG